MRRKQAQAGDAGSGGRFCEHAPPKSKPASVSRTNTELCIGGANATHNLRAAEECGTRCSLPCATRDCTTRSDSRADPRKPLPIHVTTVRAGWRIRTNSSLYDPSRSDRRTVLPRPTTTRQDRSTERHFTRTHMCKRAPHDSYISNMGM